MISLSKIAGGRWRVPLTTRAKTLYKAREGIIITDISSKYTDISLKNTERNITGFEALIIPLLSAAILRNKLVKRRFLAGNLCFRILGPLHVAIITRSGQRSRKATHVHMSAEYRTPSIL